MILQDYANLFGINPILLIAIVVWSLIWKGFALWKAGRRNQPIWFVVLLVVNALGLLEILYIFVFSELGIHKVKKKR